MFNILTIDEDALFSASPKAFKFFPRISSEQDYRDTKKIAAQWREFYDRYEYSHNIVLSPFAVKIYTFPCVLGAKRVERVDYHDQVLRYIPFESMDSINIINVDQHHDQSIMHGMKLDCSNWAAPQIIEKMRGIKKYNYLWFYTPMTSNFNYIKENEYEGNLNYVSGSFSLEEDYNSLAILDFDIVVFCKSRAYVPSNFWNYFDTAFHNLGLMREYVKMIKPDAKDKDLLFKRI